LANGGLGEGNKEKRVKISRKPESGWPLLTLTDALKESETAMGLGK
jgi:hypothetical protein